MNISNSKDKLIHFFTSSNINNFILVVLIGIVGQIAILILGILLNFSSAEQFSFEYLFIFTFVVTVIIASIRHGYGIIFLFIIELFIVIHEETNSLYNLKTYMYTGFTINLGYQEAIPGQIPAGGYPIAIAMAWIFLIYGCYNFTNFLLDGTSIKKSINPIQIPFRIFLDGMFLWQFSLLVEAVGIDLGYWVYGPKDQPKFFGAPMDTLYYYLIVAFLFNSFLRISEQVFKNKFNKFEENSWFNGFSSVIFLYFWLLLLVLVLLKFGLYHWAFFVGTPSFFIFLTIFVVRFILPMINESKLSS